MFSVQVTPGWWGDKIITPAGHDGMIGKKCAFRGVLQLTYSDGTTQLLGSDTENWKAGIAGPVKHAGIFDGEEYDAREPQGYLMADQFKTPEVNTEFNGEILPSAGAEIYLRKDLAMTPVKTYVWKDVENVQEDEFGKVVISREYATGEEITLEAGETLVVDFGQNAAAIPSFTFKAASGTMLTFLAGEMLNDGNGAKSRGMDGPEGSVHRDNLRIASAGGMKLTYTFADNADFVTYYPHCTFFGYRFASITATDQVTIQSIQSIPVTSITENLETGVITTGNESINKLISNTIWGQRSNYLSVPTDCPQRNERLGWTADTQVFAETGTFFANTLNFFHKWMRDMRDSQSETGGFPGVAPIGQYGENMMRLGWADAGVIVPWTVWKQFGDTQIIDENWDAMNRFINHVNETHYDHTALSAENGNYQWADWLSYEALERDCRMKISHSNIVCDTIEGNYEIKFAQFKQDCSVMYQALKTAWEARWLQAHPGQTLPPNAYQNAEDGWKKDRQSENMLEISIVGGEGNTMLSTIKQNGGQFATWVRATCTTDANGNTTCEPEPGDVDKVKYTIDYNVLKVNGK